MYILTIPPPWGKRKFLFKFKNREEFEGGLVEKKGTEKGEKQKKENSDKTHDRKKSTKTGKNFRDKKIDI